MANSLHNLPVKRKVIIMSAAMSALFLVALDQTIISTSLGAIVREFNSFSSLGFIVTAYLLTKTVTVPLAGKLSDMYGRKPLLVTGVVIFTISSLLSGLAPSMAWLIAWRALQGVGGGIITASTFAIVGDLFSARERGKWQGMIGTVFGVSSVAGPLLGGWLTDGLQIAGYATDWRWTFFINVPVGVVAAALIIRYCPRIRHSHHQRPDYLGACLLTMALSAIVLAVDNPALVFGPVIASGISLGAIQVGLWLMALVAIAILVGVERRARQPIMPPRFFMNRTYRQIMVVALLFGGAFLGAILYLTQFNQQVFGTSAVQAGLMLLPMVTGITASSIGVGRLVAMHGRYKRFLLAGCVVAGTAMLAVASLGPSSLYWHEAVIIFVMGLGLGSTIPVMTIAVQNEFTQQDLGAATASVQLFKGLGSTIGTAVFAGVFTAGVLHGMGDISQLAYVQTVRQLPAGQQLLAGEINANKLLALNTHEEAITQAAQQQFAKLPGPARQKASQQLAAQQSEYTQKLLQSFADALHRVFIVSASLMGVAALIATRLKEQPLAKAH